MLSLPFPDGHTFMQIQEPIEEILGLPKSNLEIWFRKITYFQIKEASPPSDLLLYCFCAFNCLGGWSIKTTICYLHSILMKRLIRRKVWDLGKQTNKQTKNSWAKSKMEKYFDRLEVDNPKILQEWFFIRDMRSMTKRNNIKQAFTLPVYVSPRCPCIFLSGFYPVCM